MWTGLPSSALATNGVERGEHLIRSKGIEWVAADHSDARAERRPHDRIGRAEEGEGRDAEETGKVGEPGVVAQVGLRPGDDAGERGERQVAEHRHRPS